jgi:hypothetical protein
MIYKLIYERRIQRRQGIHVTDSVEIIKYPIYKQKCLFYCLGELRILLVAVKKKCNRLDREWETLC